MVRGARDVRVQASEEVRKENEALKAKVAKLEYRVKHLSRALEAKLSEPAAL